MENALEGTFLGSAALPSSSIAPGTSDDVGLSEAASVTAAIALDSAPSVVGPATSGKRKRQRKGQPNEKGKDKKSAAPNDKVVITRTLRSNKKNVAGTKNADSQAQSTQAQTTSTTSMKTESLETSFTLRYTPSPVPMSAGVNLVDPQVPSNRDIDSEVYPDAKSSNPTDTAMSLAPPTISKTAQLLNIAPPQRSPIPAMDATFYRRPDLNSRSTLSANHFVGMQAPSPGSRTPLSTGNISAERGHGFRGSSNHPSKSQRSTPYQQGPIFHTQFQNIGPWDYIAPGTTIESVSNVQAPDIPVAPGYTYDAGPVFPPSIDGLAAYYSQGLLAGQYHDSRPLAPAFDWENHIPSSPMEFMYPPDESISMDNIPQIRGEGHPEVMSVHAPFASQPLMAIVADTAH